MAMEIEQYYIKVGRRYKPVERFTGFPADGIWIVKDAGSSSQLIMKIPTNPITEVEMLAAMAKIKSDIKEQIVKILLDRNNNSLSVDSLSDKIAEAILGLVNTDLK